VGVTLSFDFYGDQQVERTLDRWEANVIDATPAWDAIVDDFVKIERAQFRTEGRRGSGGWAPLSPRYARWKATHYPGKPILQREGDLVGSLTERPLGIEVILPHYLAMGSDVEHGEYHQAPKPGSHVPRRRPIDLTEADRRRWVKILQRHIVHGDHGTIDASDLPPFKL
jgi:hypothetical protein